MSREQRVHAEANRLSAIAGTYGNVFDGFAVTESLLIPRRTEVFAAMEKITSGVFSVSERPFHSANPDTAGVPAS
jgi:hypothetical protein